MKTKHVRARPGTGPAPLAVTAAILLAALGGAVVPVPGARAVSDPDSDSFGIYFDAAGVLPEAMSTPFQPFDAYLLLANPLGPVDGFECTITTQGGSLLFLSSDLGPQTLDVDGSPNGYAVGAAMPYPVSNNAVKLIHWQCLTVSTAGTYLLVGEATQPSLPGGWPVVTGGGVLRRCLVRGGDVSGPVACVNAHCVVADEPTSFGAVKGLYR